MGKVIKVGMADLNVAKSGDCLTTLGLGSCIGITLYDPISKVAGLAHIMLPSSKSIKNNSNPAKFADTAMDILIDKMIKAGARKTRLVSKIAGGAQMFSFSTKNDLMKIGQRNAIATKEILKEKGIRLIGDDTGGNFGRTIEINSDTGILFIKTIGKGTKEI
ncbi:chemotaxis protein CheD [Anaeromicrobium sediminis]|uniref:Probable chemoreceptor glutamine deamidase CheD n=1 Tax=Anaeromicrobium sediminis TaxID=1478221 RepID=A0A267MP79_9FIRM|nr:chemotaxis protein CheD [Anaeromicrobium sediminis]PAB61247.1 chemotaxis protein CheD [Anaeromicrobium sediminis]